ncbi:MAG: redox-sensing transcriptional repressor Rex [Acidimicrobiia bacterium]|nr:redox-sensing transcriptional repressor Rex [Acidimicrobiia bacterium]MYB44215.1 redox-sensing transcriptional repressor Rex [Acidimicrobiia bacterium]MYF83159.1 redox-sensing transcriptional repressor Rex [Acidimicrobiia bacterium]
MKSDLPSATVERLPRYLRCIERLPEAQQTISSGELARLSNLKAAGVRRDLSYLGTFGIRGVGYRVKELNDQIRHALGLTADRPVAVVGIGNLGSALANYTGFGNRGFRIVGLYDADPSKIGTSLGGVEVRHISRLPDDARTTRISVGIIATPAGAAQQVAAMLVDVGVRSILNFAPTVLQVPEDIHLRQVDVATELQILGYYMS